MPAEALTARCSAHLHRLRNSGGAVALKSARPFADYLRSCLVSEQHQRVAPTAAAAVESTTASASVLPLPLTRRHLQMCYFDTRQQQQQQQQR